MKKYRITGDECRSSPWLGVEFEVPDDATPGEVAIAAWDAVAESIDFGWEPIAEQAK